MFVDCIGDCRISNKNKLEMTVVVSVLITPLIGILTDILGK